MTEENTTPLGSLEAPLTPLTPLEPSEHPKIWISIEERGFVTGYGSSEISDSICLNKSELPEEFETYFSFYRLNEQLELVYDDTLVKEINAIQEEISKIPTDKEKIKMLEDENRELNERVISTEGALLDLILTQTNLKGVEM